jgi:hypothetical protein
MKKIRVLLFFLMVTVLTFGQKNKYGDGSFDSFSRLSLKSCNVIFKMPLHFNDLKKFIGWKYNENEISFYACCPIIQSDDKECILMYTPPFYNNSNGYSDNFYKQVKYELNAVQGYFNYNKYVPDSTVNRYVTFYDSSIAENAFNSDSVCLINVPSMVAYKNIYKHAYEMMIYKKDHVIIKLIWLFTDKGIENKESYIGNLYKYILYKVLYKYNNKRYLDFTNIYPDPSTWEMRFKENSKSTINKP